MVKYDENDQFDHIACDKCGRPSPSTDALILNHGLTGMGWKCLGGSHVCSVCVREPEVASSDH